MKPIAITCGDPAGVGPEIITRWLQEHPEHRAGATLIGPEPWLRTLPEVATQAVGNRDFTATPGKPTEAGAHIAAQALEEAAMGCREGRYRAVVTAPVSKEWMQRIGWNFPGQTEFFADRWHGEPSMAFAGGQLRVVLATWHIPLESVPRAIDEPTLTRAVKNADFLARRLGAQQPRIGVCGVNPHAGEGGILGLEESGVINPLIRELQGSYPGLTECLPGDTVFWRQRQGEFDVVIAMYHDQGLAPVKTLDFERAVNLTLGLPFPRTSPDHGTAFDIAGQAKASITSFTNAVELAAKLSFSG